jgi:cytochrome P450
MNEKLRPFTLGRVSAISAFKLLRDPLGTLTDYAKSGDIVQVRFGSRIVYLVSHPDLVKEVLVDRRDDFFKGRVQQGFKRVMGNGLLVTEGRFHTAQRSVIQPAFAHPRMPSYDATILAYISGAVGEWWDGQELEVCSEFKRLVSVLVARILFGADFRASGEKIRLAFQTLLTKGFYQALATIFYINSERNPVAGLLDSLPTPRSANYRTSIRTLESLITEILTSRENNPDRHDDLLDFLLHSNEYLGGRPLSKKQIRDEIATLLLASFETTAASLNWLFFLLAGAPSVERQLKIEIDTIFGGGPITSDGLRRLTKMRNALLEANRLYPPTWILGRVAVRDTFVGGIPIVSGSSIAISPWVMHRDSRFFDEPDSFRPDRWSEQTRTPSSPSAYIPFGLGHRSCVGEPLAKEIALATGATVMSKWRLELVPGQSVVPQARFSLMPKGGLRMTVRKWNR